MSKYAILIFGTFIYIGGLVIAVAFELYKS